MSIIHDALKKVQTSLDRTYGRETKHLASSPTRTSSPTEKAQQTSATQASSTSKQPSTKSLFILGYSILFCLGLVLVLMLKMIEPKRHYNINPSPMVEQRLIQTTPKQSTQQAPVVATTKTEQHSTITDTTVKPSNPPETTLPTSSPTTPPKVREGLILSGTMLMDNKRVALINDDVYIVGDKVDGKEIIEIKLKEITLKAKDGSLSKLKVFNRK